jgi:hypothetical protein
MASHDTLPFPHPRSCPAQADIPLHQNMIKNLEEDITAIENEISSLQTRLRHLQQRKANHVSYISTFRRLPSEILSEIVYICLHDGVNLTALTQTCGTLRDVVVGMSDLWNEILLLPAHHKSRRGPPQKPWVSKSFLQSNRYSRYDRHHLVVELKSNSNCSSLGQGLDP